MYVLYDDGVENHVGDIDTVKMKRDAEDWEQRGIDVARAIF
jgi:hypothetical protein